MSDDFGRNHPISVGYDTVLNKGLKPLTNSLPSGSGTIRNLLYTEDTEQAITNSIECSSCHDVHNQGYGTYALLKEKNNESIFCLSCHDK